MRPKPLSWSHGSQVYTAAHKAKSSPVKQVQRQSLRSSRRSAEKSRKERRVETDGNLRTIQRNAPLPSLQLAQERLPGSRLPCRQQRARKVLIDADLPQVQALRVGSAWLQLACLRTWRTPSSAVSGAGGGSLFVWTQTWRHLELLGGCWCLCHCSQCGLCLLPP